MESGFWMLMTGAMASFAICVLLVATKDRHGHLSLDSTMGVQKIHDSPTPRVGGVAIAGGLIIGLLYMDTAARDVLLPLTAAAAPAFAVGLWEDLTKRVSVRARLCITFGAGLLGCALSGIALSRVNVVGMDLVLASVPLVSVVFTAFAVGGAANAFNIIDGFNGLAAGVAIVCLVALAAVAASVGDGAVVQACLLLAAVTLGFLAVNFPLGKIFLGDGGAYTLGFLVAWMAIVLPMRNPSVSVWATLLACAYPILETCFSILRRSRRDRSPGDADRLHMHSLVRRRVVNRVMPGASMLARNSATGALMWIAAIVPALLAVTYFDNTAALVTSFVLCAFGYSAVYARLTQFRWCFRAATLAPEASAA
ncbi:MraY family glycosyltransferase [Ramlibacter albus]|uniref:Glycosyltransferase family 4 protein n=1 Tax=Ramlibacter albus TaxID=2079448 RepID=A0A923M8H7_9BURK|nr:glycosyltransferase [Ramlibacter albus]MBC5765340.1 glycosyltransferase family 4 protein [Ramlibacter albus]